MVAWFKWLLKSDIGTILQHRPTAFALVLMPFVLVGSIIVNVLVFGHRFVFIHTDYIFFSILTFLIYVFILTFIIYVLLKKPIKILLANIPGLVLGCFWVMAVAHSRGGIPDIGRYVYSLQIFPVSFVLGTTFVVLILLIWYLWKTEDLWFKAIGIPLLLVLLYPYMVIVFLRYAVLLDILCFFIILVYFTGIKLVNRFSL